MEREVIYAKIDFVTSKLEDSKKYLKEYDRNEEDIYLCAIERVIEQVVETTIKINSEILKDQRIIPKSYKDTFLEMKTFDIDKKLLQEMANTAKFRNELAHEYLDMSKYYAIKNIKNIIKIYPKYLKKIIEILR